METVKVFLWQLLAPPVLLLLLVDCANGDLPGPSEPLPPMKKDIGEPALRAGSRFLPDLFASPLDRNSAYSGGENTSTVEDTLEMGLQLAGASPVHLAIRGIAQPDSVRCKWRDVARTSEQREQAIRFWLDLDADDKLPSPTETESLLLSATEHANPVYPATVRANLRSLARGGTSTEYQFLVCYIDFTVSEYLLGTGLTGVTTLTVAYDRVSEERSYDLYRLAHTAGEFGNQELFTEAEYQVYLDQVVSDAELTFGLIVGDWESVVFLAPMGAHSAIAVEAWQAVAQWDLQTEEGGVVNAVRYGASQSDPEYTQTLANLKSRITVAAASDAFTGKRIASADGLTQYYKDIGAYDDIAPADGSTDTFTPAQPPPVPECATGAAVASAPVNRVLVRDCELLLSVKETLAGTATLNWSVDTAMSGWEGVNTGGQPLRVTSLNLNGKSLGGSIPPELANLYALTTLNLNNNQLTGIVPPELGNLSDLTTLELGNNKLSGSIPEKLEELAKLTRLRLAGGNVFTGCIPEELEDIADHDLAGTGLSYCLPPDLRTAYFYPTYDILTTSYSARTNCPMFYWKCLGPDEPDEPESDGLSNAFLANGGTLRLGFTVKSEDVPGAVTGVWFEARVKAHASTARPAILEPGDYGYQIYSGSGLVAEMASLHRLAWTHPYYDVWTDETVSGPAITSGLSGSLNDVAIQINGPSSWDMLSLTRLRMVVEYDANRPAQ